MANSVIPANLPNIIAIPYETTLTNIAADGSGTANISYTVPSGYRAIGCCCWLGSAQNRFVVWSALISQVVVGVLYLNHRTSAVDSITVRGLVFAEKQ